MPNYVDNDMRIYGDKIELNKIRDAVAGNGEAVISFDSIIPQPDDTSEWAEDIFPGWYNWNIKHWGTKWNALYTDLSEEDDHLFYQFTTAWSPPFPIYDNLFETYPRVKYIIKSWDFMSGWAYEMVVENGKYTNLIREDTDIISWKNDLYIELEYRKDLLKDKIQILKSEILHRPETKSLPATASETIDEDDLLAELDKL